MTAPTTTPLNQILDALQLDDRSRISLTEKSSWIVTDNPATSAPLAWIRPDDADTYERAVTEAQSTFQSWRAVPAPVRGQVVRAIGDEFRTHKSALGELISLEVGKIRAEGQGEVQETIDVADLAVGLSRQLCGITMPSERPLHRMSEQWLPLGIVGVISAFNFPNAVWAWNAMLAAVCGDVVLWKPSLYATLTAIATNQLADRVATKLGHPGVFRLLIGTDLVIGERLIADRRVPLISATGSTRMGKHVGQVVAARLGRSILELGGNNGCIVDHTADLDLALKAVVFSAVGTAGQRCTTTRRLILHESIADRFVERLAAAYRTIRVGDPLAEGTLVGPLISDAAVQAFHHAVKLATEQGATIVAGSTHAPGFPASSRFVQPTIIRAPASNHLLIAQEETFAPIVYVFTFRDLDNAIDQHNSVEQGLASSIFTTDLRASEQFLSADGSGSDCGMVYVNMGTSGAEIGGAFGGDKESGGGRESGSDSWKTYMRRQTATIHRGKELQLAQGIRFE